MGLGLALAQKERRGRSERAKGTLRGGAVTGTPETARNIGDGVDATRRTSIAFAFYFLPLDASGTTEPVERGEDIKTKRSESDTDSDSDRLSK